MEKIGFKNFRRFANFHPMDLAPITILVGENNAGKSTAVKGILALSDFLNNIDNSIELMLGLSEENNKKKRKAVLIDKLKNRRFYFNTSYLTHIGTFKRALYNKAKNNIISFSTRIGYFDITIEVSGERNNDEMVFGVISKITIEFYPYGFRCDFDLQKDIATVLFSPVEFSEVNMKKLPIVKENAKSFLKSINRNYEIKYRISDYLRRYTSDFLYTLIASSEIAISSIVDFDKTEDYIGSEMMSKLNSFEKIDEETKEFLKDFTTNVCNNKKGEEWIFTLPESFLLGRGLRIEYIYAHAVTQTVIYSAKDTNDYLSRTIHEFASTLKSEDDYRRKFITDWMKEFKIGVDYEINSVGGEAHIVKILNKDGELVNLADKGMGSIQLMVLLFRLAISLPKNKISEAKSEKELLLRSRTSRILIIEEPEQNLHPKLQSRLADLLHCLNKDYGYRFIIETHSEYLIRKTQVIVKENYNDIDNPLSDNPFRVYYFNFENNDIPYYEIKFQNDGNFENDFGPGFFDEASNLAFDIL